MNIPTYVTAPTCPICVSSAAQVAVHHRPDLGLFRCRICTLVYRASALSDLQIATVFGDDYYQHWGLEQSSNAVWTMKLKTSFAYLSLLQQFLPKHLCSPKLLDIGCAHGFMLEAARQKGFHAFGIDISPAVHVAKKRGFTVYDQPLQKLCLPSRTFEAITMIDVIEHIPDRGDLIRRSFSQPFRFACGKSCCRGHLAIKTCQDEGFYLGLRSKKWKDSGIRKQLSPGINLPTGNPGGIRKVIPSGSDS